MKMKIEMDLEYLVFPLIFPMKPVKVCYQASVKKLFWKVAQKSDVMKQITKPLLKQIPKAIQFMIIVDQSNVGLKCFNKLLNPKKLQRSCDGEKHREKKLIVKEEIKPDTFNFDELINTFTSAKSQNWKQPNISQNKD